MRDVWVCCQLGAREHYAIPRALHRKRALELLVTDFWCPPRSPIQMLSSALSQRFHADLPRTNVRAFNIRSMVDELKARTAGSWHKPSFWRQRLLRNESFQKAAAAALAKLPQDTSSRIVMGYSYMSLHFLRLARARGWRTVVSQIDPGRPEQEIVGKLGEMYPYGASKFERAPTRYWNDWLEECSLADRIVVNSAWCESALTEVGIPQSKIRIIPLAYEGSGHAEFHREYPPAFSPSRPMRVLFLGQVNLRKGIAPLLEAIKILRESPIEFWIVGPMQVSVPEDLQRMTQVRWVGPVGRSETARFYREADLFIFPTFSDGFGLTQLEAQSWKLPIVASRNCGQVVRHGRDGLLLPEISSDAIVAALRHCCERPALLQEYSNASANNMEFGLRRLGERWLQVFD